MEEENEEKLTVDGVRQELDREEECLLRIKEMIQQQLKVLKAEEVTISRLIQVHSQQESQAENLNEEADDLEDQDLSEEMTDTHLPSLNLDVPEQDGIWSPELFGSEEEYDSNESEEDDVG